METESDRVVTIRARNRIRDQKHATVIGLPVYVICLDRRGLVWRGLDQTKTKQTERIRNVSNKS